MGDIPRRPFLGGMVGVTIGLSGCMTDDSSNIQDTDGDGVIDSEDYAPKDPEVQRKADVAQTTATPTTRTETVTPSPTSTPSLTPTLEPTATDDAVNTLTVRKELPGGNSTITEYSLRHVSARINPEGPDARTFSGQSAKLLAIVYRFPRDEALFYGTSDAVDLTGTTQLTAEIPPPNNEPPVGERLHALTYLMDGDTSVEEVVAEDLAFFHETDPFVVEPDGTTSRRNPHPDTLADDSGEGFDREALEGAYNLRFEGSTQGQSWATSFYIYKSAYVSVLEEPRGRSRPEYVSYAQQQGFADELTGILSDEAEANGFTTKNTKVEFVIDFIQNLPYVPDDVSKGFDDYTKFATETITEAGGDCEDTAVMLAAVLQAPPFEYDTVLIELPGHMAVGVYGSEDLPGVYYEYEGRRYYYVETTGTGWGIGDLPDIYRDKDAYIYQV